MADPKTYVNDFGVEVDPFSPNITGDNFRKSVEGICTMRRFSNNPNAMTVAEHSYVVAALCRGFCGTDEWKGYEDEAVLLSYLHDVHEGYYGYDAPAPLKWLDRDVHDGLEDRAMASMLAGLGLSLTGKMGEAMELVGRCDRLSALIEMRNLMESGHISGEDTDLPMDVYDRTKWMLETVRKVQIKPEHMIADILHLVKAVQRGTNL